MQDGYRIEKKYIISLEAAALLRDRLSHFMSIDSQAVNGAYRIRSLYFDTPDADAFMEKENGEEERRKYRLRYYNGDHSFIRLEQKEKKGDLTRKVQANVDMRTAIAMQNGEYEMLLNADNSLLKLFYAEAKAKKLAPSVTVDYRRVPFTYWIDNVRITIDTEIYAGNAESFFRSVRPPFPVLGNGAAVLEVKTDNRLPYMIGRILETVPRQQQSYSKYALSYARLNTIENNIE